MKLMILVLILSACLILSIGCVDETSEKVDLSQNLSNETMTPEVEIITIKSVNTDNDNIIIKIKNEGNVPVDDLMVGYVEIKLNAVENSYLYSYNVNEFKDSLTFTDAQMLINNSLFSNRNLFEKDEFTESVIMGDYAYVTTSIYGDYVGTLEPNEMYESTKIEAGEFIEYKYYRSGQINSCTSNFIKVVWSDGEKKKLHDTW